IRRRGSLQVSRPLRAAVSAAVRCRGSGDRGRTIIFGSYSALTGLSRSRIGEADRVITPHHPAHAAVRKKVQIFARSGPKAVPRSATFTRGYKHVLVWSKAGVTSVAASLAEDCDGALLVHTHRRMRTSGLRPTDGQRSSGLRVACRRV